MKNVAVPGKAALVSIAGCALLLAWVTGCGGPTAAPSGQNGGTSAAASPSTTPTPKKYSTAELETLVGQVAASNGATLKLMPQKDVAANLAQMKALLDQTSVEPAGCKEAATAGANMSIEGATIAMGLSQDAAAGTATAVALTSGVDRSALEQSFAKADQQVATCGNMTVTLKGATSTVSTTKVSGVGNVPGTLAYRTDTGLANGQRQSIIVAQALKGGVLMTVTAAGGASEKDAIARAGDLLDHTAEVVK